MQLDTVVIQLHLCRRGVAPVGRTCDSVSNSTPSCSQTARARLREAQHLHNNEAAVTTQNSSSIPPGHNTHTKRGRHIWSAAVVTDMPTTWQCISGWKYLKPALSLCLNTLSHIASHSGQSRTHFKPQAEQRMHKLNIMDATTATETAKATCKAFKA